MESQPITSKKINDFTLVISTGAVLDNNNAHEMVEIITEAQDKGFKNIIIDMAALGFISSAGVGSILGTIETSREAGGDIILCNAAEVILHVLKVLDLTEYLTIKNDLKEVVARCGAGD